MPKGYYIKISKDTLCQNERKGKYLKKFDPSILEFKINNFKKKENIPISKHISSYDMYLYNSKIKRSKKYQLLNIKKDSEYKYDDSCNEFAINKNTFNELDAEELQIERERKEYLLQLQKEEDRNEWLKEMAREERISWKAERFLDKMMMRKERHRRAKIKKSKKLD
jgi:hypothetical protein